MSAEEEAFGRSLAKARVAAGLTQENVAGRLYFDVRTLRRYESGERRPDAKVLETLEAVYGITDGRLVAQLKALPERPRGAPRDEGEPALEAAGADPGEAPIDSPAAATPALVEAEPPSTGERELTSTEPAAPTSQPARRPANEWRLVGVAVAAGVGLVVLAYFALGIGRSTPARARVIGDRSVDVRIPASWRVGVSLGQLESVRLSKASFAASGDGSRGVAFGIAHASGPTLLTVSFRRRLAGSLPDPRRESLSGVVGYAYDGLRLRDLGGSLSVFVAPVRSGVLTIACFSATSTVPACRDISVSPHLPSDDPAFPLGPRLEYARALNHLLTVLNRYRTHERKLLERAATPAAQAARASALARGYEDVYRRAGRIVASPLEQPAHGELVRALRGVRDGYQRMARAARANSASLFRAAKRDVRSSEAAFQRARHALATDPGYRLQ